MNPYLQNKQVLLGITGSIAAYKSADLVRRLREVGATVRVVMTQNAKAFITPLTMQAVSGFPIHDDLFDLQAEAAMGHIELARWADLILVAPATADFIARLTKGLAEDLLSTLCLATNAPIVLAPAMNQGMWLHAITQENMEALKKKKVNIFEPGEGSQACGDVGPGRMMEPLEIVKNLQNIFATGLLAGKKVLITAGPTHEYLDPVRFLTNKSSGKMGYALAQAAFEAGAQVTLISGPVKLAKPTHLTCFNVISAQEMLEKVLDKVQDCDIFISVAAVADYRSEKIAPQKIQKKESSLQLHLIRNPDIISEVANLKHPPFIVGFAAETEDLLEKAKRKKQHKKMDLIIANRVDEMAMDQDDNEVTVLMSDREIHFSRSEKNKLARQLINLIAEEFRKKTHG